MVGPGFRGDLLVNSIVAVACFLVGANSGGGAGCVCFASNICWFLAYTVNLYSLTPSHTLCLAANHV